MVSLARFHMVSGINTTCNYKTAFGRGLVVSKPLGRDEKSSNLPLDRRRTDRCCSSNHTCSRSWFTSTNSWRSSKPASELQSEVRVLARLIPTGVRRQMVEAKESTQHTAWLSRDNVDCQRPNIGFILLFKLWFEFSLETNIFTHYECCIRFLYLWNNSFF